MTTGLLGLPNNPLVALLPWDRFNGCKGIPLPDDPLLAIVLPDIPDTGNTLVPMLGLNLDIISK